MDGTLIDSSPAVTAAWNLLKETGYDFLDLPHILASAHGYRTIDALRKWCKIEDEELLKKEVVRFEEAILANASKPGGGIIALPGVKTLLDDIQDGLPEDQQGWSVCTSCMSFSFIYVIVWRNVFLINVSSDPLLRIESVTCCRPQNPTELCHSRERL